MSSVVLLDTMVVLLGVRVVLLVIALGLNVCRIHHLRAQAPTPRHAIQARVVALLRPVHTAPTVCDLCLARVVVWFM